MIGSCPECNEAIRVPELSEDQLVRCPLCNAEYRLEKALASLPPSLVIVGQASPPIQLDTSDKQSITLATEGGGPTPEVPTKTYQPRKRKEVNMGVEMVKIVVGGLLAIPVGILCVWWFAGRAPFGVAESVSRYVPWIVPENLRAEDPDEQESNSSGEPRDEFDQGSRVPAKRRAADRNLGAGEEVGKGVLGLDRSIEDDFLKMEGQRQSKKSGNEKQSSKPESQKGPGNAKNGQSPDSKIPTESGKAPGGSLPKSELNENSKVSGDPIPPGPDKLP